MSKSKTVSCASTTTEMAGPSGVGGWLLVLVAGLMVLGPLSGIGTLETSFSTVERQYPGLAALDTWQTYKSVIWGAFLCVAALSFYAGAGLAKGRDMSVVKRAKVILWIFPVASIVMGVFIPWAFFGNLVRLGDLQSFVTTLLGSVIGSVITAAVWTAYLSRSKRVRATYVPTDSIRPVATMNEAEYPEKPAMQTAESMLSEQTNSAFPMVLVIVGSVVIAGIVAAIAIPAYHDHAVRAKLAGAGGTTSVLPSLAKFLEAARPDNPGVSDAALAAYWRTNYGSKGAEYGMPTLTLQQFRQAYPEYNDMSDEALGQKLHDKFYSDIPFETFAKNIGLPNSTTNRLAQLQKQADSGDAAAQYNLGVMYIKGEGMLRDPAKAAEWIQKAATQGYAEAQNHLRLEQQEVQRRENEAHREQEQHEATEIRKIDEAHPGWKQTVKTKNFSNWMSKQPASVQRLAASNQAQDAILMLDLYKRDRGIK